ncbi:MAG: ATP synthase F1 subunit gamma [Phycisphaerales bacterium]|nr:ATP synthase F1 subunit gamma [Phycisphaerales bacterium]
MANARQIVKRRKAVTNIRKITKTMQLIATARFQQAYNRATATKPYTQKITQLVEELSQASEGQVDHPLMRKNPDADKDIVLVLTSSRGLCGGYNANLLRTAMGHLNTHSERNSEIHVVGKKGIAYFKFLRRPIERGITDIDDRPRFEQVEPIATEYMQRYEAGEIANVYVAYMKFISTGKQTPEVMHLLPLEKEESESEGNQAQKTDPLKSDKAGTTAEYDFSPEPAQLLKRLLPQTVKVRLYQCFTDAAVSEQVARMVAMKAATDAAGEMIKTLTRQYNRARQTQITMELLDIVGGAEALA